jgi:Cd2+/Zn2+-exporting ATPase
VESNLSATNTSLVLTIPDMECPGCAGKVESALLEINGVKQVSTSVVAQRVTIHYETGPNRDDEIRLAIHRAGYTVGDPSGSSPKTWRSAENLRTILSGIFFAAALITRWVLNEPDTGFLWNGPFEISTGFFLLSALVGGINFFPAGFSSLRSFSLDMNFLMTAAIFGAVAIGEYMESAAIAFLFSVAELLEAFAVARARRSLKALMDLAPDVAVVRKGTDEVTIPVEEVQVGDLALVRPGEKIPVDGNVREGTSDVDQSPITGESMSVEKQPGARVFAGTLNLEGYLEIETSRPAAQSTLTRIIRMVEDAEDRRAPSEKFVQKFSRYYTPAVTGLALCIILIPVLLLGGDFGTWCLRGLTLLVIACPCALVISTPVAVVSGITSAARNGVLIKGGNFLESLADVRVVAFDKTGTLTTGKPELTDVLPAKGHTREDILRIAAALETRSQHPIARAVLVAAEGLELPSVTDFKSVTGKGVQATIDARTYKLGKPGFLECGSTDSVLELQQQGKTTVLVGNSSETIGVLAFADAPRPGAAETIQRLRKLGIERVVMLTGDNSTTAQNIAALLGIDEWHADLMPEDKVEIIEKLSVQNGEVAMVGDGVNDAPAMARASVGIAMGAAGTDAALETADVALMADDLTKLPYLFRLTRKARRVIRQNVWSSLTIKLCLAVGVIPGFVSLVVAVLAGDMGTSLGVTGNALRLARVKPE